MVGDSQKNRLANKSVVEGCLDENGVRLAPAELELVFREVAGSQASVDYLDLIAYCRGQMSSQRESAVEGLFNRLDTKRSQEIHTDALMKRFKPQNHPDAKHSGQSAASVKETFSENLTLFGKLGV